MSTLKSGHVAAFDRWVETLLVPHLHHLTGDGVLLDVLRPSLLRVAKVHLPLSHHHLAESPLSSSSGLPDLEATPPLLSAQLHPGGLGPPAAAGLAGELEVALISEDLARGKDGGLDGFDQKQCSSPCVQMRMGPSLLPSLGSRPCGRFLNIRSKLIRFDSHKNKVLHIKTLMSENAQTEFMRDMHMKQLTVPSDVTVEYIHDMDIYVWYGCLVIEEDGRVFSPDDLADEYQDLINHLFPMFDADPD